MKTRKTILEVILLYRHTIICARKYNYIHTHINHIQYLFSGCLNFQWLQTQQSWRYFMFVVALPSRKDWGRNREKTHPHSALSVRVYLNLICAGISLKRMVPMIWLSPLFLLSILYIISNSKSHCNWWWSFSPFVRCSCIDTLASNITCSLLVPSRRFGYTNSIGGRHSCTVKIVAW